MKTFALSLQLLALLFSTVLSSMDAKKKQKENNEIENARKRAYELGERHHMQARLKTPDELGYFVGETLIDVGCGYGKYLRYFKLRKKIKTCVGLDLKKKAVHSTKRLFREKGIDVPLIIGDAQNLPFEDDTFDIAFSTDMVEHLPSSPRGVQEIVRVSKDKVVICVPNKLNPVDMSHIAEVFGSHHPPEIENYLTRFQLNRMLQNAGINKETIVMVEKSFLPLGWLFVNKKTLLPMSLVRASIFVEGFLEKTPLKHMAGVLVSCSRKASSGNRQKQNHT
jgi:ubiquinone/menaquinone biosynthesis C-methylase UbiE